jgi:cyclophilin family peptidyl-prolyl cis-trans isomerase
MHRLVAALLSVGLLAASASAGVAAPAEQTPPQQWPSPPAMIIDPSRSYAAMLQTTAGDIVIELLPADAPTTVNNFVFLAREGFYDGTPFHRVINGFMIQTGDPTGTGRGGPGYRFADEPVRRAYEPGIVAMANAGPNTNGSQFFIVQGEGGSRLPPNYTIFGRVASGMDIVNAIATAPVQASPSGESSVPVNPVRIVRVTIAEQ